MQRDGAHAVASVDFEILGTRVCRKQWMVVACLAGANIEFDFDLRFGSGGGVLRYNRVTLNAVRVRV